MKRALLLLSLVAALAPASPAQAGGKESDPIQISDTWAQGGMGYAHNNGGPDGTSSYQSISCSLGPQVGTWYMICQAHSGARSLACYSSDAARFADTLRAISGDSEVGFGVSPDGTCAALQIRNGSLLEPKMY